MSRSYEEIKNEHGEEAADAFRREMLALASLLNVSGVYFMSEVGSVEEAMANDSLDRMIDDIRKHPDHSASLLLATLALIAHVRQGNTVESWFEGSGIEPLTTTIDDAIVRLGRKE